jgi:hypothetical protein
LPSFIDEFMVSSLNEFSVHELRELRKSQCFEL